MSESEARKRACRKYYASHRDKLQAYRDSHKEKMKEDKIFGTMNLVVGTLIFITFFLSWQFNIGTERDLIFFGIASVINLILGLHLTQGDS